MPGSTARHFVDAVHRRMVLLRCLEQIGRGLFAGSIVAIALLVIAICQSLPTTPILLFCAALGLITGCVLMVFRWPTRMAAALETDRQLRLDDLLATALFSSAVAGDDFCQPVLAMADARCRLHSPSEVLLRQLGVRSWSGIGLAMAIAVTVAVIPLRPSQSQATDTNISVLSSSSMEPPGANLSQPSHGMLPPANDPTSETASNNSMTVEQPLDHTGSAEGGGQKNPGTGINAGVHGGGSTTDAQPPGTMRTTDSSSHMQTPGGTTAGGGGGSADNALRGTPGNGMRNDTENSSNPPPGWNGNGRADSQAGAPAPDDRIPPTDRDLVRDFFNQR